MKTACGVLSWVRTDVGSLMIAVVLAAVLGIMYSSEVTSCGLSEVSMFVLHEIEPEFQVLSLRTKKKVGT